jgi:hypothetical protein
MCEVPLDLQRKFERRWAARFARPTPPAASQAHQPEGQNQQLAAPEAKEKAGRVEAVGLRSATAA